MRTLRGVVAYLVVSGCLRMGAMAQEGVAPVVPLATAAALTAVPASPEADAEVAKQAMAPGDSHIRIVRLSEVRGEVTLDRRTGQGLEATMQNMPVVEGARLETREGLAEIEFEDQSTLRVAPHSLVEFPQLVLRGSGAKATTVKLVRGMVYVSLEKPDSKYAQGNEFVLLSGTQRVTMLPATHLRVEVQGSKLVVAVIQGEAQVASISGADPVVVGKKKTLTLDSSKASPVELAKGIDESAYDEWDKDALDYHKRYGKGNALVGTAGYGTSDLNYYGSFSNVAGCGMMWQPYLVSAAWNPYANGVWALYPGAGYSWVSPYPWGWTPYHTGSWSYCPSRGWGWQPGGGWNGLNNLTAGSLRPIHPVIAGQSPSVGLGQPNGLGVPRPPRNPGAGGSTLLGGPTLVGVNSAPLAYSKLNEARGSFEFRKDSAGLGVPRGSLGGLNHVSRGVEQHGLVTRPVYVDRPVVVGAAQSGGGQMVRGGPSTIRPGTPPMRDNSVSSMPGRSGGNANANAGNSNGGYRPSNGGYQPGGGNSAGGYRPSGGGGGAPSMSSAPSASAAPAGGGGGQARSGK